jgi:hypothetical protein
MFLDHFNHHESALGAFEALKAERLRFELHGGAAVGAAFLGAHGSFSTLMAYGERNENISQYGDM